MLLMKKHRCEVCGKRLVINRETVYVVNTSSALTTAFGTASYFNAVDCPQCGCQKILKQREMTVVQHAGSEVSKDESAES